MSGNVVKYRRQIERIEAQASYWKEVAFNDFLTDISQRMTDRNITRAVLAERLHCSRPAVTQALRGDSNLTLSSLVRYARATGGVLHLHIADEGTATTWHDEPWGEHIEAVGGIKP